jgi:hypothetical protein
MERQFIAAWESFYVIVGSSGGALIGLQFVVMTLLADRQSIAKPGALSAFGTPTVVHLTSALVISAIMSAPWRSLFPVTVVLATCGGGGLTYAIIAIIRARRQTDYQPVFEDWLWYLLLPCIAYGVLTVVAFFLRAGSEVGLFEVAVVALGLLLIGIHNAWDTVTHIVITGREGATSESGFGGVNGAK